MGGPVHFIAVNTEAYYYTNYGLYPLVRLWQWPVNDLKDATTPANRKEHPWIVIYGHRPMYCSTKDEDDCTRVDCHLRTGIAGNYAMETLFEEYGVDLAVWA